MAKSKENVCSFCGRSQSEVPLLLTGAHGFICSDCIQNAYHMLEEYMPGDLANDKKDKSTAEKIDLDNVPKP